MPYLYARQNPLDDARNTLSSWDNCMAKNYCKFVYPSLTTTTLTYKRQVASNSRNHSRFSYCDIGRSMHCTMHLLRRRVRYLLL